MKLKIVFLVITSFNLFSQGSEFNLEDFKAEKSFPEFRGSVPSSVDLAKYLPFSFPQSGGTCVAMSFCTARTMLHAIQNNVSNQKQITRNMLSPYFLYYLARKKSDYDCEAGLNPVNVSRIIKKNGFQRIFEVEYPKYYPFSNNTLCPNKIDFYPPSLSSDLASASDFAVKEVYVTKELSGIKYALSLNMPVVLCMQVSKSFELLNKPQWIPALNENKNRSLGGHAVVIIGYNDSVNGGSFKIFNSWGESWGAKGMAWISYRDIVKWMDGAFIMEPYKNSKNYSFKPEVVKPETIDLIRYQKTHKFNNSELVDIFNN